MTNKQWRKTIYQWLASENFAFNKERHRKLKQLLNARETSEESEEDDFLEPDEELETDNML